ALPEHALEKASLESEITGNLQSADVKITSLTLDDSHLTGLIAMKDFTQQLSPSSRLYIEADLTLDQIDLDKYIAHSDVKSNTPNSKPADAASQNMPAPATPPE